MAGNSYPPSIITAFALGPTGPVAAARTAQVAAPMSGLAPAASDFFSSAAFGLLVLLLIFLYLHTRIL